MQYQIIDKEGTIIAWIDTEKDSILVHSDYTIISGEDLDSTTINGEIKPINNKNNNGIKTFPYV